MGDNGDRRYLPAPAQKKRGRGRPKGSRTKNRGSKYQYDPDIIDGFTPKQSRFLREYVKEPTNVSACARRAGITPAQGYNIVKDSKTKAWLEEYRHHVTVDLPAIQAEAVFRQENAILNSDVRRLPFMPREVVDMDDETAAALSGIKITRTTRTTRDGSIIETEVYDFKFWSKDAALDRANRRAGLYELDNKQKPGTQVHGDVNITQNNVTMDISDIPRELRREFVRAFARKRDTGDVVDVEAVGDD